MKVFKVIEPIVAFKYELTSQGTNLNELKKEVADEGGTLFEIDKTNIGIEISGKNFVLPPNHALVLDGSNGSVMPITRFINEYVDTADGDVLINRINERLEKLEKEVASFKSKSSSTKKKTNGTGNNDGGNSGSSEGEKSVNTEDGSKTA